jgi:hypothetical protein
MMREQERRIAVARAHDRVAIVARESPDELSQP